MNFTACKFGVVACALAAAFISSPSLANGTDSGSFRVTATVPMACWINHTVEADAQSGSQGSVVEGCNNTSGYVVSASHRPLASDESAQLRYGNSVVQLSKLTTQEVNRDYGPTIQEISYSFVGVSLFAPLTISLTIQPI